MGYILKGLNLGCGWQILKSTEEIEWVNLDSDARGGAQVVRDVLRGLPFADNTFDQVFCSHFLEHFGGEDLVFLMGEIHRVLKPRGMMAVLSPYYLHHSSRGDPHHKVFMDERFFESWWFPNVGAMQVGVRGFFHPLVCEVADNSELRVKMVKVPAETLQSYIEVMGVGMESGRRGPPNWQELLKGKLFYEVAK